MTLEQIKAEAKKNLVLHKLSGELGGKEGDYMFSPQDLDTLIDSTHQATVEEIIKILDTSRTLEEKYGVGVKEQTAREQVKADILIAIKK
jgi:hypothetical protein